MVLLKEEAVVLILSGLAVLVHLWNAQALVLVVEADVGRGLDLHSLVGGTLSSDVPPNVCPSHLN